MPTTFTTSWKKIGQSGPTMDGRDIEAAWLEEAAEIYNPSTYTAVIWIDHFRFYGSQGKVVELKAKKDGNIVSLYAKLQPNEHLLSWNKEKQKLFTSMELTPDFAKSGKCYLSGLGVTDMPASLGTHELHFNSRKQNPGNLILCGVELDAMRDDEDVANQDPGWLAKAKEFFTKDDNPEPEEDTMTDEQMKQFAELMGVKISEAFTSLKDELVKEFSTPKPKDDSDSDKPSVTPTDDGKQNFSVELAEAMKPFSETVGKIDSKLDDLTKRFEQVNPGTVPPTTIIPADGANIA